MSATGKQLQYSAFHSSPKYLKEWGSVGPLKLNASQQKSKLSPRIFSCNLTILWITTCLYVFLCPNSKHSIINHRRYSISKQSILKTSIYFQLKILITGNLGILNILNGAHQIEICFWCHPSTYKMKKKISLLHKEILVVSCSSMLHGRHP